MYYTFLTSALCALLSLGIAFAQVGPARQEVSGTVLDNNGQPLPGANVLEKGTSNGTVADIDGKYSLVADTQATLVVSFVGYQTLEVAIAGQSALDLTLKPAELEEVIVVGARSAPRSSTDSPLPVDVLSAKDLAITGQTTFDKALQYKVPSFNTVQAPVNDATSLLDPYEIRNMGPSRTLILINGKRKNLSALLYTQASPGRGETGADISAIPTSAIKRVEVLRDGASAQYGSDAIAGVMNIVLKDDAQYGELSLRGGVSARGDGAMGGLSFNNGAPLGKGKGFINYTIDLSRVGLANRPGKVAGSPGEIGEYNDFVYNSNASNAANAEGRQRVADFLRKYPDAHNINGAPATTAAKFLVNGGFDVSKNASIYFNAAYVYKKVNSFANYRTPYWKPDDQGYLARLLGTTDGTYVGYAPTFDGDLNDYNATLGFKATSRKEWTYDFSLTIGGNQQLYGVTHTLNFNSGGLRGNPLWNDANQNGIADIGELSPGPILYRSASPTSFRPGGTQFEHIVGNIDVTKRISNRLGVGFGSEFRSETFTIIAGEEASYAGGGADSFAGNRREDAGRFNRYNFGGYLDLTWDIFDDLLLNGTARVEQYSDFGLAFVWKVSTRYKFLQDKMTIRASFSTGFRAPTLHQIYTQKAEYIFGSGVGIQLSGIVNNISPQAYQLGVPRLSPERSTNITAGLGGKFFNGRLDFTVDYYNIAVQDRIVLSAQQSPTATGNMPIDNVLSASGYQSLSFFINGMNTRTSGVDVVVGYKDIKIWKGLLNVNLAGNYTIQNEREGAVKNPEVVRQSGLSVVDNVQESFFFTSRPKTKWILGISYEIGRFDVTLSNTLFGKTYFTQAASNDVNENLAIEFIPKVVTDLSVTYEAIRSKLFVTFSANNLADIYPEWKFVARNPAGQAIINDRTLIASGGNAGLTPIQVQSNLATFNQRYSRVAYNGSHFSQLGALFALTVSYKL